MIAPPGFIANHMLARTVVGTERHALGLLDREGTAQPWCACICGVVARRWGAWRRTGGGGSAVRSGRGGNEKRTGGFRGGGAPARFRAFAVMLADQVTARQIERVDHMEPDDERYPTTVGGSVRSIDSY